MAARPTADISSSGAAIELSALTTGDPSRNPNCVDRGNYADCDLLVGTSEIGLRPGVAAKFTNRSGSYIQVNRIEGITRERTYWGEFCAYLSDFATEQKVAGKGEVGCVTKLPGEDYPPLRWHPSEYYGISVAPGEALIVNANWGAAPTNHSFALTAVAQQTGIISYRAPKKDEVIPCNSSQQSTRWDPWRNDSGKALHLEGATIYAASPGLNSVKAACLYILDSNHALKFRHCDGVNVRGELLVQAPLILPGEYVTAQAINTCAAPGVWDWAAFLYIW